MYVALLGANAFWEQRGFGQSPVYMSVSRLANHNQEYQTYLLVAARVSTGSSNAHRRTNWWTNYRFAHQKGRGVNTYIARALLTSRLQAGKLPRCLLDALSSTQQLVLRDQHRVVGVDPVGTFQKLGSLCKHCYTLSNLPRHCGQVLLGLHGRLVQHVHHQLQQLPVLDSHIVSCLHGLLAKFSGVRAIGRGLGSRGVS